MGRLTLTRRSFVKTAAVVGAAAAFSASGAPTALAEGEQAVQAETGVKHIRSCCRGCGKMECGVWVTVENGRVVRTEGDESAFQNAGNHCAKGQASLQAAYHPSRLRYPLRRTGPKGEDPAWERISWEEAYQGTVDAIHQCQDKYGKETCIFMGGTSRIWSMAPYGTFKNLFQSPNGIQANEICKGPRFYATSLDASNAYSWMEVVGRPHVFVQWGGASELSNYDDSCRTTVDVATRATAHILVDPRQTNLGKEADYWINLRPGTDGAVANCWAQVIIDNELYDDLYVRKWMNAPMLVVEDESFEPSECGSATQSQSIITRLLKESDINEDGSNGRFMVLNELTNQLSWYDATQENPGWEGEDWQPATEGFVPNQNGLDLTGQEQGFVLDYVPFPDGLYPALHTPQGGFEVELKDGKKVKCRTVWEHYIDFLEDYTPAKASEITGVDAKLLEESAKVYATRVDPSSGYGNGGIQYMLAPEHACNAVQNQRACDLVCGITGNMDVPGGMRGSTPGWPYFDLAMCLPDSMDPRLTYDGSKILGQERFPMIGSDCGPGWADATSIYDAIETGEPYKVSCGIGQTGDFMNQSNSMFADECLRTLDFWCSMDLWHTPCVDLEADIVMPAAHWLELDCIRKSQGSSGAFGATVKAIEPPGEAKNDLVIVAELFEYVGIPYFDEQRHGAPYLHGAEAEKGCNEIALAGFRISDWDEYKAEFQEKGWFDSKIEKYEDWGVYRRYQIGNGHISGGFPPTPVQRQGWNTTTHKQEIWSTVLESWLINNVADRDDLKPGGERDGLFVDEQFPRFFEAPHGPVAEPERFEDDNAFLLTTGRRQGTYFHSEHRQLPWCRELWPVPRLEMNPEDAERLGVTQGDWVWIETDWGDGVERKIREVVDLYYGIQPGVVNAEHQWWYPELDQADRGYRLSGVNCLIDRHAQDRICASSNLRAYGVKVYKATSENSPFGNPVPCADDGTEIIHTCDDPRLKEWLPDYDSARGEA